MAVLPGQGVARSGPSIEWWALLQFPCRLSRDELVLAAQTTQDEVHKVSLYHDSQFHWEACVR